MTACSVRRTSGKLLLFAALLAVTASCGKDYIAEPVYPRALAFDDRDGRIKVREENPVSAELLDGMRRFALASSARVLTAEKGNALYSPYSLYIALALAASGAEGATREEMMALLGGNGADNSLPLTEEVGKLIRQLHADNEVGRLKTANSLWVQNGHTFRKEYGELAAGSFYASLHQGDFARKETADRMSEWVRKHTSGQISPEIQPDPQQVLALLNTLDFKDEWTDAFNESQTEPGFFYPQEESPVSATFMNRTFFTVGYSKGEGYASASLGLKHGGSMTFVLPDKGSSVDELAASLEKAGALLPASGQPLRKLVLKVPKFEYSSGLELAKTLQALGMETAFTDRADFGGMTDTAVYISGVKQDTHIAIDEKGVEAAAFTQILMAGGAQPNGEPAELILDRPFLYSITAPNGVILFAGICRQP